jgi:arginine exporter protein ArgO
MATQGMRGERFTVGAPGTSLSWTETLNLGAARQTRRSTPVVLAWLIALVVLVMVMSFLR